MYIPQASLAALGSHATRFGVRPPRVQDLLVAQHEQGLNPTGFRVVDPGSRSAVVPIHAGVQQDYRQLLYQMAFAALRGGFNGTEFGVKSVSNGSWTTSRTYHEAPRPENPWLQVVSRRSWGEHGQHFHQVDMSHTIAGTDGDRSNTIHAGIRVGNARVAFLDRDLRIKRNKQGDEYTVGDALVVRVAEEELPTVPWRVQAGVEQDLAYLSERYGASLVFGAAALVREAYWHQNEAEGPIAPMQASVDTVRRKIQIPISDGDGFQVVLQCSCLVRGVALCFFMDGEGRLNVSDKVRDQGKWATVTVKLAAPEHEKATSFSLVQGGLVFAVARAMHEELRVTEMLQGMCFTQRDWQPRMRHTAHGLTRHLYGRANSFLTKPY